MKVELGEIMARKFKAKVVSVTDRDTIRLSGRGRTPKYVCIAGMNALKDGNLSTARQSGAYHKECWG